MGGFLFIAGVLVAVTVGYLVYMSAGGGENEISPVFGTRLFAGVVMALAFAFLGFVRLHLHNACIQPSRCLAYNRKSCSYPLHVWRQLH